MKTILTMIVVISMIATNAYAQKNACSHALQGKDLTQVAIHRDGQDVATGGVYKDQGIYYLVTAGHVFPSKMTFIFHVLFGGDTLYVSGKLADKDDATVMILSKKKQVFKGFSPYKNWEVVPGKKVLIIESFFAKGKTEKMFSLCGEEYQSIGIVSKKGFQYPRMMIKKASIAGESGTIFYDVDGNVFVLSEQHVADSHIGYEQHGVSNGQQVSLLSPVGFSINIVNGKRRAVPW